eukprot:SAG22_NODE_1117_length_5518_cov_6.763610_1_plen_495_part_10
MSCYVLLLVVSIDRQVNFFTYASVLLLGPEKISGTGPNKDGGGDEGGPGPQKMAIFWFCLCANALYITVLVGMVLSDVIRNQGKAAYELYQQYGWGCAKVFLDSQKDKYRAKMYKLPCCKKCKERHEDEVAYLKTKKTGHALRRMKSVGKLITLGATIKSNKHKTIKKSWLAGLAGSDIHIAPEAKVDPLAHLALQGGIAHRRGGGVDKEAKEKLEALEAENVELKAKLASNRKANVANRLRLGVREQKILDLKMGGAVSSRAEEGGDFDKHFDELMKSTSTSQDPKGLGEPDSPRPASPAAAAAAAAAAVPVVKKTVAVRASWMEHAAKDKAKAEAEAEAAAAAEQAAAEAESEAERKRAMEEAMRVAAQKKAEAEAERKRLLEIEKKTDRAKHIGGQIAGAAGGADAMEFVAAIKTIQATRQQSHDFKTAVSKTMSSSKSWLTDLLQTHDDPHGDDFSFRSPSPPDESDSLALPGTPAAAAAGGARGSPPGTA